MNINKLICSLLSDIYEDYSPMNFGSQNFSYLPHNHPSQQSYNHHSNHYQNYYNRNTNNNQNEQISKKYIDLRVKEEREKERKKKILKMIGLVLTGAALMHGPSAVKYISKNVGKSSSDPNTIQQATAVANFADKYDLASKFRTYIVGEDPKVQAAYNVVAKTGNTMVSAGALYLLNDVVYKFMNSVNNDMKQKKQFDNLMNGVNDGFQDVLNRR